MDKFKILSGNTCFLVQNTSNNMSKKDFEDYLKREGFKEFRKYWSKDRGCFYINVNSLCFSEGVSKPAKLTGTIVGESLKNPFSIDEFRTIWEILKKHITEFNSTNEITKGCSIFLVCDDLLKKSHNEFLDYLNQENFKPLHDDSYGGRGFIAVNVKDMIYSDGSMANILISTFVGDNSSCALTIDEFKIIWDIIKEHNEDYSVKTLLKECVEFDDYYQVIDCCDKIFEIDPDNAQGFHYKAWALFKLKEYEKALDLISNAISIYPQDYVFYNIKAFILTDLYRIAEAIEYYNSSFYLGGFDTKNKESTYQYRAKCYFKKAREDFYIKNDLNEALRSLNIYLNQFEEDKNALRFKDELSNGKITPYNTRYHEKLMYFECKAYELYKFGYLKESFETYKEVLNASQDFKNNINETGYKWFDSISGHGTSKIDNFKWYDEVLSKCLMEFKGDYEEFFLKLFEVDEENISACIDKAKLFSKIYREKLSIKYSKNLVEKCPSNSEAKEFYNIITEGFEKRKRLRECSKFKDYRNIDEYIEDVIFCLINSCRYSEESAKNFVKDKKDEVRRDYEHKYPAYDLAMDYFPICG